MTRFILTAAAAASALVLVSALPAAAGTRNRHHHTSMRAAAPPAPAEAPARPFMFYPQEVEGGVSGNLPFNNQVRKHTDPLNANGSR